MRSSQAQNSCWELRNTSNLIDLNHFLTLLPKRNLRETSSKYRIILCLRLHLNLVSFSAWKVRISFISQRCMAKHVSVRNPDSQIFLA